MTAQPKATLKGYFNTGDTPTEAQFADLIDSLCYDFNVKAYGALGDGLHDDTQNIQAAIDAAEAAGGGVVFFPRGIYIVGGPLQSPSNSQLVLPSVHTSILLGPYSGYPITIELKGEFAPQYNWGNYPTSGVIIKGTLNTGTGALLGCKGPAGSFQDISQITVKLSNLLVEMPANPVLTALHLGYVASVITENLVVDAGGNFNALTIDEPTHDTSYGIIYPYNGNAALVSVDNVVVFGFYHGIAPCEHFEAGHICLNSCKYAVWLTGAGHTIYATRMLIQSCSYGLYFSSGSTPILINLLNIEHYSTSAFGSRWCDPVADIYDPDNNGKGYIVCYATNPVTVTIVGATGLRTPLLTLPAGY